MVLGSITSTIGNFLQSGLAGTSASDAAAVEALASSSASTISTTAEATSSSAFDARQAKSLKKEIRISHLYVHPIKSCRGLSVASSAYDESGLRYDRAWLIVDAETRRFQTVREHSELVLVTPTIDEARNELRVTVPFSSRPSGPRKADVTIATPLNPTREWLEKQELVEDIHIWHDKDQSGYAVSAELDAALSDFLGKPVRLVRKGPKPRAFRITEPDVFSTEGREAKAQWDDPTVRFQDDGPILITTDASMRHVQASVLASVYPGMKRSGGSDGEESEEEVKVTQHRIPDALDREQWTPEYIENLEIQRFRPNVVLTSADDASDKLHGFEEDDWQHVEIFPAETAKEGQEIPYGAEAEGKGKGIYVASSTETGVRDPYLPSRVLQGYRIVDPANKYKPCFGMLSVPRETEGTLHVGDIVRVTRTAHRTIYSKETK